MHLRNCLIVQVGFENSKTGNKSKLDLLVMENVFYGRDIQEKYDLKGSIRNRLVDTSTVEESKLVLWDENLLKVQSNRYLHLTRTSFNLNLNLNMFIRSPALSRFTSATPRSRPSWRPSTTTPTSSTPTP